MLYFARILLGFALPLSYVDFAVSLEAQIGSAADALWMSRG